MIDKRERICETLNDASIIIRLQKHWDWRIRNTSCITVIITALSI